MARVAICTSVLNQRELLEGMIASVRAQTFADWKLFIVDDGSTEDLKSLCEDDHFSYMRFPENRGVPHGMNEALTQALASGADYIGVLSTDERIHEEKLALQVEYLDKHPNVGAVWGLPQQGPMGERPSWEQMGLKAHNRSSKAWVRTLVNLENVPIGGASMLMRADCVREIGLFDPEHFTASDLEWFCRFFEKFEGRVLPYRWAVEVERKDTPLRKTVTAAQFQADMEKVRAKHPVKPPKVMAEVTVAIPVRNMAQYIAATLNSVLSQTWVNFKVVVLDDASTDNTVDIVRSFNDPRISLLQFDENRGCNEAQNQMLARCETPFFAVLAADDLVEHTWLERLVTEFVRDPWLEFVGCQTDFIDTAGEPYAADHPFKTIRKAANMAQDQWKHLLWYGNVYFGAGLYRTYAAKDVGGWDTTVGCLGDYDMYLKLLQRENIHIIEEPLVHTRIHENNRSILKTREEQLALRVDYKRIKDRYYPPRMKVVIATPFYEMKGWSPYITSLVNTAKLLTHMGVEFDFWQLSGDSYVERAKNTIMTRFLEDPEATDLFMIDSDMEWNADAVVRMLALPDEVVVGSYPQKNSWGKWTSIPVMKEENGKTHPIGRVLDEKSQTAILKADYLAGGFMRIKRSALEKFRDSYPDLRYHDSSADPSCPDREYICFSECITKDGRRWGEDRIFGQRLNEIGVEVMIYPNIEMGHYGVKGWTGNFDQFLRGRSKPQDGNTTRVQ